MHVNKILSLEFILMLLTVFSKGIYINILLFLLFLLTAVILDIRPDPILQIWDPGVCLCFM